MPVRREGDWPAAIWGDHRGDHRPGACGLAGACRDAAVSGLAGRRARRRRSPRASRPRHAGRGARRPGADRPGDRARPAPARGPDHLPGVSRPAAVRRSGSSAVASCCASTGRCSSGSPPNTASSRASSSRCGASRPAMAAGPAATPVIGALATLAYDGRRADFFRSELLHALRIVDEGNIEVDDMLGSWAGAMGQSQFMPSSYVRQCGRLRRRRPARHLEQPARRVRLDRQLSRQGWLERPPHLGPRGRPAGGTMDGGLDGLEVTPAAAGLAATRRPPRRRRALPRGRAGRVAAAHRRRPRARPIWSTTISAS